MSFRETVSAVERQRLGTVSSGFYDKRTAVSEVLLRLARLEAIVVEPRPLRIDEVTWRVQRCLGRQTSASLTLRDWRVVPWVMWVKTEAAEHEWFLNDLFRVLSAAGRPLSIVRALVQAYVANFDPSKPSFMRVAQFLRSTAITADTSYGKKWLAIDMRFSVFDLRRGPVRIAEHVRASDDLHIALDEAGISEARISDALAMHAFVASFHAIAQELPHSDDRESIFRAIQRIADWNTGLEQGARYLSQTANMATILLEAFEGRTAIHADAADLLLQHLIRVFGDPRLNSGRWQSVSQAAMNVAMSLLIKSTLEDFFSVIDATAEQRHWRERHEFWLDYYRAGAISGAWVAFGPNATTRARNLDKRYGKLLNATDKAHSAVILQFGDLTVVEWSHNGRCRFFPKGGAWSPGRYEKQYDYREMHAYCRDDLTHQGYWQTRFAARIFRYTRIKHPTFGKGSEY